jgi:hypothetical protein
MADSPAGKAKRDQPDRWNAREIERRNREELGKPLSPIMKTAATARELNWRAGRASG